MRVWLVARADGCDDYYVEAVFDSLEKAKAFIAADDNNRWLENFNHDGLEVK